MITTADATIMDATTVETVYGDLISSETIPAPLFSGSSSFCASATEMDAITDAIMDAIWEETVTAAGLL